MKFMGVNVANSKNTTSEEVAWGGIYVGLFHILAMIAIYGSW